MSLPARLLWTPSAEAVRRANLTTYMRWLGDHDIFHTENYADLWKWSTDKAEDFWASLLSYFKIRYDGSFTKTRKGDMLKSEWFEGISLNFAEHVFEGKRGVDTALLYASETSPLASMTWAELTTATAGVAKFLLLRGVDPGDRVAAFLPCIPEATISFLAANSIGAVWSSCSPDFGAQAVIDRFAQVEPKVLITIDGYRYGGKFFDKTLAVREIVRAIPSIQAVVVVSATSSLVDDEKFVAWANAAKTPASTLTFNRMNFSHPIWILFSSGTTGLPKAITHSHGGVLLEHLKYLTFHNDVHPGEKFFWYTTTGWMMWNYLQGALLCGAVAVLYDGSPAYPDLNRLWELAQLSGINHFGTSAGFILACMKDGVKPAAGFDLKEVRSLGSTGSTLPPEGFDWVYANVKRDVWLTSMSGGTDVCSAFVGGNPLWPVYAGEIQCRALGCNLQAWNEHGRSVVGEVGEMVITQPMPSMPVFFWNDKDFSKYKESYFDHFPGVWRHGDWIEVTERQGVIIYGRSDATLNRGGVRIGTSEIYRSVDKVGEVKDSLILCLERDQGEFYMPLFVVLKEGFKLTDDLKKTINTVIRSENSPRHVPDEIVEAPDIPYTISGKKTETPVKKILMGRSPDQVVSAGALKNPESINFFVAFYNSKKIA